MNRKTTVPEASAGDEPEHGSFSIRQNGITVAGGSGPYEWIKREAAHYAAIYRQDGEVQVRVRRSPRRKGISA